MNSRSAMMVVTGSARGRRKPSRSATETGEDAGELSAFAGYRRMLVVLLAIEAQLVLLILLTGDRSLELVGPAFLVGIACLVSMLLALGVFVWEHRRR